MSTTYDTIYFKRGLDANLPATANNGEPLWTTDTHRMFVGYGSGIKEIAGTESLGYVTPEMFGTVDGVNDEVQIQLAIDSLPVSGGNVVLKKGVAYIGSTVTINKSNVTLTGGGAFTGTINLTGTSGDPLYSVTIDGIDFNSATFTGDESVLADIMAPAENGVYAISMQWVYSANIRNCYFKHYDAAFYVVPIDAQHQTRRLNINGNRIRYCNYGLLVPEINNIQTFSYTAVNAATNRITINNHGYVATTGNSTYLEYTAGTDPILYDGGPTMVSGHIYLMTIIDINTLEFPADITSVGTGTGHFFKPRNWTAADITMTANYFESTNISQVYARGIDGLLFSNNTCFFPGSYYYTLGYTSYKNQNLDIAYGNVVTISNNHLFEAGLEAIRLDHMMYFAISGNNIVWPGQATPSPGIVIDGGNNVGNMYCAGSITGNEIAFPTDNVINILGKSGYITITGNQATTPGNTVAYYGKPLDPDFSEVPISSLQRGVYSASTTSTVSVMSNDFGKPCELLGAYSIDSGNTILGVNGTYSTIKYSVVTASATETTLDVTGAIRVNLNQSGPTNLATLTRSDTDKTFPFLYIHTYNNNTTIVHDVSKIVLAGNISFAMKTGSALLLCQSAGVWQEVSRNMGYVYAAKTVSGTGAANTITPRYIGDEYLLTTGPTFYKSTGVTTSDWIALN